MSHKRHHTSASPSRQEKRRAFEPEQSHSPSGTARMAGKVAVVVAALAVLYFALSTRKGTPGADLSIPISDISEQAKFYNYTLSNGTNIGLFVIKSSDGVIRAAFNACDVCYRARKGYHQEGDDMVCNKCGRHFPSKNVNVITGECNPGALARTVQGDRLVIRASDLEDGNRYF